MARTEQLLIGASNLPAMVHYPSWHSKDCNGLRGIIACHGHSGSDIQISEGGAFAGHPEFLADHGYVVASVSTGDTWLNSVAMDDITALYNWLIGRGISGPKVGLLGWSMGGGHCLRWLIENAAKVASGFLCSPLTDLDWAYSNNTTWATELNAAYNTYASANGSARAPINNAAAFRGGPKILIAHATDDTTVPYSKSVDFVNAVNDPAVKLRQPDIVGNHQGGLTQVKPRESWEWLRINWF